MWETTEAGRRGFQNRWFETPLSLGLGPSDTMNFEAGRRAAESMFAPPVSEARPVSPPIPASPPHPVSLSLVSESRRKNKWPEAIGACFFWVAVLIAARIYYIETETHAVTSSNSSDTDRSTDVRTPPRISTPPDEARATTNDKSSDTPPSKEIRPLPNVSASKYAVVTTIKLNLRTGPGAAYQSIATVSKGAFARVVGFTENGWVELDAVPADDGQTLHGFVKASLVEILEETSL